MIDISVLETAPVWTTTSPTQALREAVDLAVEVERLGYLRFWVAEHHNAPFIASCAPPVLVAHIAARTSRLRVGSGGVMLPNHPPLVVAEQFGTLEALNPGRIDLGVGRSPGTDSATARELRRVSAPPGAESFREQVRRLLGYFDDPAEGGIAAVPAAGNRPGCWLLGSSVATAVFAGELGLPFAFGHHVRPENAVSALRAYRESFRPSPARPHPRAIVAASVLVADTDAEAERLSRPIEVILHKSLAGTRDAPNLTPDAAARYIVPERERAAVRERMAGHLIGGPGTVGRRVGELLAATGADELMAMTVAHGLEHRVRSYELLAKAVAALPG
ncbi:MAG TPA: LLM class flavin-dependent oxidoreductase [Streptosporangiaceae bacterium]|nr:LLM class flavin-dependent oxidoreductase [Streptosporangiaceae bacterium]